MTTLPGIHIHGARRNDLKGFRLDLPLGELRIGIDEPASFPDPTLTPPPTRIAMTLRP